MICKETIKQRKAVYGSNFEEIAKLQSEYLEYEITPKDVAKMMAIMKNVRINFIKSRLSKLKELPDFHTPVVQAEIKTLNFSLEDSVKDYSNYEWIAENFSEYEAL